jgi:hypothetical protein
LSDGVATGCVQGGGQHGARAVGPPELGQSQRPHAGRGPLEALHHVGDFPQRRTLPLPGR